MSLKALQQEIECDSEKITSAFELVNPIIGCIFTSLDSATLPADQRTRAELFLYIPRQWDSLNIVRFSAFSVFVAQMLKASGNELYYHTWPTESGKHNYEIDFRKDADVFMVPVFMTMFL